MHLHRRARRFGFSQQFARLAPASFRMLGLGVVLWAGGGCGLSTTESGGADTIKKPELLCVRAGAERVEASSFRGGGKNDLNKIFMRSTEAGGGVVLSCKELDLNADGRKDMLVYYDGRGRKLREEFDHDFDGLADMKSYYEGGQLARQELDLDFDGKPDLVEYFEGGKRVRLEKLLALPPAVATSEKADPATTVPSAAAPATPAPATAAPVGSEASPGTSTPAPAPAPISAPSPP